MRLCAGEGAMRGRVFRLLQRLRMFVVAGPRAAGLLLVRDADTSARRRGMLLDQLASYEA